MCPLWLRLIIRHTFSNPFAISSYPVVLLSQQQYDLNSLRRRKRPVILSVSLFRLFERFEDFNRFVHERSVILTSSTMRGF